MCFDCPATNPTWASVTTGTYMCLECSGYHRQMGVHITFVRSIDMDDWSMEQLRTMELSGNEKAAKFFRANGCRDLHMKLQDKYSSPAAKKYAAEIKKQVAAATAAAKGKPAKAPSEGGGSEPPSPMSALWQGLNNSSGANAAALSSAMAANSLGGGAARAAPTLAMPPPPPRQPPKQPEARGTLSVASLAAPAEKTETTKGMMLGGSSPKCVTPKPGSFIKKAPKKAMGARGLGGARKLGGGGSGGAKVEFDKEIKSPKKPVAAAEDPKSPKLMAPATHVAVKKTVPKPLTSVPTSIKPASKAPTGTKAKTKAMQKQDDDFFAGF